MGSSSFIVAATGPTPERAFFCAIAAAQAEHGNGGYTGTIAEKYEFLVIPGPSGVDAEDYAAKLIEDRDPRISDKWGPAGCVQAGPGQYVFFGVAPT